MKSGIYCLFGIDGSGKTTTIEALKKRLERKGIKPINIYMGRGRDHKLPFISLYMKLKSKYLEKKIGGKRIKKGPIVDIYRERNLLFMGVYYLDLWMRYLKAKKLSKKNVVLIDRYFYDGLTLSKEKHLNFFLKITPKPTKSFFLYAPPKIIRSRKKQASEKNIMHYIKRVQKFKSKFNIIEIDTSQPLEEVLKKIESEI